MKSNTLAAPLPGENLGVDRMPGHWLLARLGKRVLRPGGAGLTRWMLDGLGIGNRDDVVEFAPGLGYTAGLTLHREPASYTAIERDPEAVANVQRMLGERGACRRGTAEATGLDSESADVLYGEAFLTMQTERNKARILDEAHRILRKHGRYGIHELCLLPDGIPDEKKQAVRRDLTEAIHVGARPLTPAEWRTLLTDAGFSVEYVELRPMRLLNPRTFLRDEGLGGTLRFLWNLLRSPSALRRVIGMRRVFERYRNDMGAIGIVARRGVRA